MQPEQLLPCAGEVQRILTSARFAAERHAGQKRKGDAGEPYINHLIEVAELVACSDDVLDANLIMAAFLHDTVEDTGVTAQQLEQRFGPDVTSLVMEVTDDKSLPKEVRKSLQVQNAHKNLRARRLLSWRTKSRTCDQSYPARRQTGARSASANILTGR